MLQLLINEVQMATDSIEMRHRKKYLLLGGVPEKPNEDVPHVILSILNKNLGFKDVTSSSLLSAHRLGLESKDHIRPILFRFTDVALRGQVWKKKTSLKGTPYVMSEFLTKLRQSLFLETRKHFGMRSVWTSDGSVYVKLNNGSRARIQSKKELEHLVADQIKDPPAPSNTGSEQETSAQTPAKTAHIRPKRLRR
ncbi:unnamed protein product, partial [Iphiclides podalirius]